MQRMTKQNQPYVVFGRDSLKCSQVFANSSAFKRRQTLRRDAKRIAERKADASFAQIQGQNALVDGVWDGQCTPNQL